MYAVTFDIDTNCIKEQFEDTNISNEIYTRIKKFMVANNFEWKQGSVYFGNDKINAVTCVTTVQKLAKEIPQLTACVRDIRMLKIEEYNDLLSAIH
ncbi:MAG: virulence factor [Arcobacteraceae bacterium]|jgi:virulence-associated protein VapD|nr:virulence factor [Arcobacteraceae bacterium]MDY0365544.1 virulence factor [Arcobacteraceae bacterium]